MNAARRIACATGLPLLAARPRCATTYRLRGGTGFSLCILFAVLTGCSTQVHPHLADPYPTKLSAWRLFTGHQSDLHPNQGVIPYDLNTPLFSDYATKTRFIWMPPGTSAIYNATGSFEFPVGTIFSKTFAYDHRLLETRLLVRGNSGWAALPYVWNESQTEADLQIAADPIAVHWTHPSGEKYTIDYVVPNVNQCKECHEKSKATVPIGPKARNLNKDFAYADGSSNQLAYWTRIGYLKGAPAEAPRAAVWDDPAKGTLEARARSYLDVNCGHCHNPNGSANTSGLYLNAGQADLMRLGVCKVPVSAGQGSGDLLFDIVDGKPEESILLRRMDSVLPKVMMPELGRTLVHREGVALIREWIRSMQGHCSTNSGTL